MMNRSNRRQTCFTLSARKGASARHALFGASLALPLAVLPAGARAETSEWVNVHGGAVRLISEGGTQTGLYSAGLEFSMEPGWHTYWRNPGEAGIPPILTTDGSKNLAVFKVGFPVPERHDDGFSTTLIYKEQIVLPLDVAAGVTNEPVELHVQVAFGICNDICVPGEATLSMVLEPDNPADRTSSLLIERDKKAVPQVVAPEQSSIVSVERLGTETPALLEVSAKVTSSNPADLDLFADGPEGSYVGVPVFEKLENGEATWKVSLRGLKPKEDGSELMLVLKDGAKAEESWHPVARDLLEGG
ncbi:protein-disulfide reductase DsbD domain-containing protein [Roseibium suaedae]|uniref:Thiol-disulfide interchange protein, contains DsbC and DsbD domains n=1 Tax=Roseibium suaedae TaxID=735517 RepID=A0A1M7ATX2_9HYPH|nr:protein-disulfide reductase DsbD domain-containing protein [Roseibium suaedae]SHL46173.1 Thiol-disulfide interchange protein, contains DsbC and DsbD domains [Roseibium suaedae]